MAAADLPETRSPASARGFVAFAGAVPLRLCPPGRLEGEAVAAALAAGQGVQVLRVHDVAETRQGPAIRRAVAAGAEPGL